MSLLYPIQQARRTACILLIYRLLGSKTVGPGAFYHFKRGAHPLQLSCLTRKSCCKHEYRFASSSNFCGSSLAKLGGNKSARSVLSSEIKIPRRFPMMQVEGVGFREAVEEQFFVTQLRFPQRGAHTFCRLVISGKIHSSSARQELYYNRKVKTANSDRFSHHLGYKEVCNG